MKKQFSLSSILLCGGVLAFAMSPAYADLACDVEVAAIQAGVDAPAAAVSAADLEQAQNMLNVLTEDCAGGSTLESVASLSSAIRSLLGMGGGS